MLALCNLPPTCDETNRAAGLSGWWSRRGGGGNQCKGELFVCIVGLKVETLGNLFVAVFLFFMRAQRVSWYPEEVQAGSERLTWNGTKQPRTITCECCFAYGTSAHEQVIVAWCYECVARCCER